MRKKCVSDCTMACWKEANHLFCRIFFTGQKCLEATVLHISVTHQIMAKKCIFEPPINFVIKISLTSHINLLS